MKYLLTSIILLVSMAGMAQDQVKVGKTLYHGKITKLSHSGVYIQVSQFQNKGLNMDMVDSLFVSDSALHAKALSYKFVRRKVKESPLFGAYSPEMLAQNAVKMDLVPVNESLVNAWNNLQVGGGLIIAGAASLGIGMFFSFSKSETQSEAESKNSIARVTSIGGAALMCLGGYFVLDSGNLLKKGSGSQELRVGVGANGVGVGLRF